MTDDNVGILMDKLKEQEKNIEDLQCENRLLKISYAKCCDCKYANKYVPNYAYPYINPKCELGIKKIYYDTNACEDFEMIGRSSR